MDLNCSKLFGVNLFTKGGEFYRHCRKIERAISKDDFLKGSLFQLHLFRLFSDESKEGFIFPFANKSRHSSEVNNGDFARQGLLMFHQADLLHTAHQILILKEYSPKSHLFEKTCLVALSLSSRDNLHSRLHIKLGVFVKKKGSFWISTFSKFIPLTWTS